MASNAQDSSKGPPLKPKKSWLAWVLAYIIDNIFFVFLLAAVFFSTLIGLLSFTQAISQSEVDTGLTWTGLWDDWEGTLSALLGSIAVIVGMKVSIERVFANNPPLDGLRDWITRGMWIIAYLIMLLISVNFSFAFWWEKFIAKSATETLLSSQIKNTAKEIEDNLEIIRNAIGIVRSSGDDLQRAASSELTNAQCKDDLRPGSGGLSKDMKLNGEKLIETTNLVDPVISINSSDGDNNSGSKNGTNKISDEILSELNCFKSPVINNKCELTYKKYNDNYKNDKDYGYISRASSIELIRLKYEKFASAAKTSLSSSISTTSTFINDDCKAKPGALKKIGENLNNEFNKLNPTKTKDVKPLVINQYRGIEATREAMRRFLGSIGIYGFLPSNILGDSSEANPKLGGDDIIPLLMILIIDGLLLIIGIERGKKMPPGVIRREAAAELVQFKEAVKYALGGRLDEILIRFAGSFYFVLPDEESMQGHPDRELIKDFLDAPVWPGTSLVEHEFFRLKLFAWLFDASARRRLGRRGFGFDRPAKWLILGICSGVWTLVAKPTAWMVQWKADLGASPSPKNKSGAPDWSNGRNFRWFRVRHNRIPEFLAHIRKMAEMEAAYTPGDVAGNQAIWHKRATLDQKLDESQRQAELALQQAEQEWRNSRKIRRAAELREESAEEGLRAGEALNRAGETAQRAARYEQEGARTRGFAAGLRDTLDPIFNSARNSAQAQTPGSQQRPESARAASPRRNQGKMAWLRRKLQAMRKNKR